MRKFLIYSSLIICLGCADPEPKKDLPIMGNLPVGEYPVGYKTLFTYDQTRNGVPYSDWDGNLDTEYDKESGRQFQINVWYPAEQGSGQSIKYDHYIDLMGRQTNFDDTEVQKEFARRRFISNTRDLGNKEDFTEENLNQLLNLDVYARLNAKMISEKFPVVVYPNGGSPAFQSITCEFLASHGYVVVATALKGRFSSGMEISGLGLEVAVDDLEFVLSKISESPNVDMNNVSLMANAISSSVCASAIARNNKLKSLISLEGGFPSSFEQRLLNESVFYKPENITVPILVIYASHPSIDPKYTFHLKYADRYYAQYSQMSEFVMLNYGMFDSFIPNILGEHGGDTPRGFEEAHKLILRFLDQNVKAETGELFATDFVQSQNEIDTTFVLSGIPSPPNIALLKDLFLKGGFDKVDSVYQGLSAAGNTQPFSKSFYTSYRSWLAWKKDESYSNRLRLYELAFDSYPESARINYYVAYYSYKRDIKQKAIDHYRKTLNLIDNDGDLTKTEKERITAYAREELNELLASSQ